MPERFIQANGVELCAEEFGDPADPTVLLVMGLGASMLWWDGEFCRRVAAGGRHVLRYDHRDTGRSAPGRPGYTGADLVDDAAGVLDAFGVPAAHVAGVSAGGGLAQLLALGRPDRVLSLTLVSTSAAVPTGRELPPPAEAFGRFLSTAEVDWSDPDSVVEYQVGFARMLAGAERPFDEDAARDLVRRDVARARDFAAARNHDALPDGDREWGALSAVAVPTVVLHGTADPMFPIGHGEALADVIPDAALVPLEGAGHGLERADWETVVAALLGVSERPERRPSSTDRW
ncbi:alpha/beta fold hydrolase [Actinomadura chibensis]|uniref:Alpha/beta hydrolase n=1 Tax=Actinomadura chibensis TaxID=392828 RepID=A0A5D0NN07_9ACTN|nr:alpha/beta fold hydrolase [Actinomadura chibensis]TYB45381.1 alpha/beta hydrolase [Actinomadura chibensis]